MYKSILYFALWALGRHLYLREQLDSSPGIKLPFYKCFLNTEEEERLKKKKCHCFLFPLWKTKKITTITPITKLWVTLLVQVIVLSVPSSVSDVKTCSKMGHEKIGTG